MPPTPYYKHDMVVWYLLFTCENSFDADHPIQDIIQALAYPKLALSKNRCSRWGTVCFNIDNFASINNGIFVFYQQVGQGKADCTI